jgi:P27 family predicted phage terminase small subunit
MKKPNAIKEAQGTINVTRDGNSIPPANKITSMPEFPESLDERGKLEWEKAWEFLSFYEMCDKADLALLELYCIEIQNYFEYQRIIKKAGKVQENPTTGYLSAHPLISASSTCLKNAAQLGKFFGFSPSARASLNVVRKSELKDDLDELEKH